MSSVDSITVIIYGSFMNEYRELVTREFEARRDRMKFLRDKEGKSLAQIGRILGISRERVRQILSK